MTCRWGLRVEPSCEQLEALCVCIEVCITIAVAPTVSQP